MTCAPAIAVAVILLAATPIAQAADTSPQSKYATCEPGKDDYYDEQFGIILWLSQSKKAPIRVAGLKKRGLASEESETPPPAISLECVRRVMVMRANPHDNIVYGRCENEKSTPVTDGVKPLCISESYVRVMRDAYVNVTRCLDEDPWQLFGLFAQESGFQLNIGNKGSKAWGVGQLTPWVGSPEMYAKAFEMYKDRPECSSVLTDAMQLEGVQKTTPCLVTTPTANPVRAFVIAVLFYKEVKKIAEKLVPKSSSGRASIVRDLAMEMYNQGGEGVGTCFKNYLKDNPDGASSYTEFSKGFPSYVGEHYGEEQEQYKKRPEALKSARFQVQHYVEHIRAIGKKANGPEDDEQCSRMD